MVYVAPLAPAIGDPFIRHWYVAPEAAVVTDIVTVCPAITAPVGAIETTDTAGWAQPVTESRGSARAVKAEANAGFRILMVELFLPSWMRIEA